MVDSSLIKYIKESLSRGASLEQIKKKLRENGWSEQDISDGINIVKSQQGGSGGSYQQNPQQNYGRPSGTAPESGSSKKIWIIIGIFVLVIGMILAYFFIFKNRTETKTCFELGGYSCLSGETCDGNYLDASDTNNCCSILCTASCSETWICTNWSSCLNNTQSRICNDTNSCGTTVYKPIESQSCGNTNQSLNCTHNSVCNVNCVNAGGDPDCTCDEQDAASTRNITLCDGEYYGCNGTKINASDTEVCCIGTCITPTCGNDGLCALGCQMGDADCTCAQQDGILCESDSRSLACANSVDPISSSDYVNAQVWCCGNGLCGSSSVQYNTTNNTPVYSP